MTTKIKQEMVGPTITKKQRAESLEFWTQLSAPKTTMTEVNEVLEQDQYNEVLEVLSLMDLTNDQIDKIISVVKAKRTTTHKSGPTTGVGKRCRELIAEGLGNKGVLAKIKEEFPNNNTTYSCIAWYRNDMKK